MSPRINASLSWIAYDSVEKARMQRVLALFRERNTRDELGLGGIRDSFSDQLFPGTSTIQTRLRYFLFVPWMYRQLESEHISSAQIERVGREFELRLLDSLVEADDRRGVFGVSAKRAIQRLPSEVYWSGLGVWGLRQHPGSQQDYWNDLDRVRSKRRWSSARASEDGGESDVEPTWHPDLPKAPVGFPDAVDLRLTREEADFLRDRIISEHSETFLALLAARATEPVPTIRYPWEHPGLIEMREGTRKLLEQARKFSHVMNGASRLYNLVLAEHGARNDLAAEHREGFHAWAGTLDSAELAAWDLSDLWLAVIGKGHAVTAGAQRFVAQWVEQVRQGAGGLADRASARSIVRLREHQLKGARSRFVNQRALDQWGGHSGVNALDYRWGTVKVLLDDLHLGLVRSR